MEKTTRELVQEWQREHPNGTNVECAKALGVSRQTVQKYTEKKRISAEEAQKLVLDWFDKHPNSTQAECIKALKLNHSTIEKYYPLWKMREEIKKGSYEPTEQILNVQNTQIN